MKFPKMGNMETSCFPDIGKHDVSLKRNLQETWFCNDREPSCFRCGKHWETWCLLLMEISGNIMFPAIGISRKLDVCDVQETLGNMKFLKMGNLETSCFPDIGKHDVSLKRNIQETWFCDNREPSCFRCGKHCVCS